MNTPADYWNPNWNKAGKVHDWKNYVTDSLKSKWQYMLPGIQMAVAECLQEMADKEEWD